MTADAGIVGIGRTSFTKASNRSTRAMAADACLAALDDAGLSVADVDGAIAFSTLDSAFTYEVAQAMGIEDLSWSREIYAGGLAAASIVQDAIDAVRSGHCSVALVYRSLNGRSGFRYGTAEGLLEVRGEGQFCSPSGYHVPAQWMAMWARRHQEVYGSTEDDLGQIAITQRQHALANEHAIARTPLTLDGYLEGRMVAEPLRVFDCCQEVDGAVALVVASLDRSNDLRHGPVVSLGHVQSHGEGGSWEQWSDMTRMYGARVAPRLWERTGITVDDIDVACIYDCFTYTVMATVEDFGFCERGDAGEWFRSGGATYGGDAVVNPHGGLLSEGYLHGLNHHYEAVLQLRGQAAARQVADAELALVTAGAGPFGSALVYAAG